MTSSAAVQRILSEMTALLDSYGDDSWARAFKRISGEFPTDPAGVLSEIRQMYGGMGSLSDIVLYASDGSLPGQANERFDALRSELYQLCRGTLKAEGNE
jgi:uncharacterized protein DUF6966